MAIINAYQAIENYGVVGDLNTIALIGINGSVDFMCLPNFDSPTIFSALLDSHKGGFFQIAPCEENVHSKQIYVPETNILLTRFLYEDAIGEITDFMPLTTFCKKNILIRRVTTIKGRITYRMQCCPRFNYGKNSHKTEVSNNEIFFQDEDGLILKLSSSVPIEVRSGDGYSEFALDEGETAEFLLQPHLNETNSTPSIKNFADSAYIHTFEFWKDWTRKSTYKGRWREMVLRSALTLKLLISEQYGAIIAAPTFSLPEKIGGNKNWDYRFVWIRDAALAVNSLISIGYENEAKTFIKWIQRTFEKQILLKPFYRVDGSAAYDAVLLTHLEGYRQSSPVTIGNGALNQLQLDIYGELIDCIYHFDKFVSPLSKDLWMHISTQIDWLMSNWGKKDDSIWEIRGEPQEFLFSRLMCWIAFDRAIKIGLSNSFSFPESWIKERDIIYKSIYNDFWDQDKGAFVQYKGSKNVDAACLLMSLAEFISPDDPKWLSTLNCIEKDLTVDCMVYRYPLSECRLFGLDDGEGTFSACSFWYIESLSKSGQLDKAQLYFEKMLSYANHLGLFSEQLSLEGEQLGNFPQAFTHLALISAACDLDRRLDAEHNSLNTISTLINCT